MHIWMSISIAAALLGSTRSTVCQVTASEARFEAVSRYRASRQFVVGLDAGTEWRDTFSVSTELPARRDVYLTSQDVPFTGMSQRQTRALYRVLPEHSNHSLGP
ncbi:hypothetical protein BC826DRAFT_1037004 [Russula brevipes]|nr:hypothetical protein BC826DRAFT_1037004 [Russula brevipes]